MPCLLLHLVPPCLTLPFFALKGYDLRFRPGSRFFIRTLSLKFSPVYYNSKLILEPASLAQLPSKFPLKHPGCRAGSHSSTMAGSSYHRRTFKEQVTSSSPSSSVFFFPCWARSNTPSCSSAFWWPLSYKGRQWPKQADSQKPLKKSLLVEHSKYLTVDPWADVSVAQIVSSRENDKGKVFELYCWAESLRNERCRESQSWTSQGHEGNLNGYKEM